MSSVGISLVTASSSATVGTRGQLDRRCPKPWIVAGREPAG